MTHNPLGHTSCPVMSMSNVQETKLTFLKQIVHSIAGLEISSWSLCLGIMIFLILRLLVKDLNMLFHTKQSVN